MKNADHQHGQVQDDVRVQEHLVEAVGGIGSTVAIGQQPELNLAITSV